MPKGVGLDINHIDTATQNMVMNYTKDVDLWDKRRTSLKQKMYMF